MQVLPSKELSPYIKHYLFLDNKETTIQKLRLFSDGNMGIVFSLKSKLIADINNYEIKNYLPGSFLYGQLNSFKDIYSDNEIALVIVVFQPNGINQLLRIPANEFRDSIISTDAVFGKKGISLEEKLSQQNNNDDKIKLLNHFFRTLISKKSESNQLLINSSLDFILANIRIFFCKTIS